MARDCRWTGQRRRDSQATPERGVVSYNRYSAKGWVTDRASVVHNGTRERSILASLLVVLLLLAMSAAVSHHHDKSKLQPCHACQLSKHRLAIPSVGPAVVRPVIVEPHDHSQLVSPRIQLAYRRADFRAPPA
jgi:hypothetical protein